MISWMLTKRKRKFRVSSWATGVGGIERGGVLEEGVTSSSLAEVSREDSVFCVEVSSF